MWVASGVSITRTISNSILTGSTSNSRRPATEQHRDLVDLQFVEHTSHEGRLRRGRAMDEDVTVPCGDLRLFHRAGDPVGNVRH